VSAWSTRRWGDLATLEYGRALRGYKDSDGENRVFGTNGPIGWHHAALFPPGVIIGRKGAYRGVHYSPGPCWVIDTAFYLRIHDPNAVDPRWAYYQLQTIDLNAVDSGSAIPSTSRDAFYAIPVRLAPLSIQRRVVAVLDSIDNLIENNRRRIALLEQMARTIYREWFVHFRYPGQEDDDLVDSTLGPIPSTWDVVTLGDMVDEIRDSTKPSAETAALPYVPIDVITPRSLTLRAHRPGSEAASSLRLFRQGDILFGAMRAYFHKVCIAPFDGVTRSTSFVLRPDREYYHYLAFLLADETTVSYAAAHSSGSTIPYAKWVGALEEMRAVKPRADLAKRFGLQASPLVDAAAVLAESNSVLTAIRDSLLPKLVTGAIDVSNLDLDGLLDQPAA
jgi:type I restriction enzyme, S subunit